MKTEIIYEDGDIIVCYKPAGLAVQTSRIGQADVVSELKNYLRTSYLGVVHRLDQPVEGLLVFGKNKKAAAGLSEQLKEGILNKHYYAVLCGKLSEKEGELVDYLRKGRDNRTEVAAGQQGADDKKAVLQYRIMEDKEGLSLAEIHIDTGRFHQIRAQMAHAGVPLLGDQKYGDEETLALSGRLGIRNVALCAFRVEFVHPGSGRKLYFTAEPKGKAFTFFGFF